MRTSHCLGRRPSRPIVVFFLSLCFAFPLYAFERPPSTNQKKTLGQPTEKQGKSRPRLIVLPLRHNNERACNGTGLAIHFLLGNVVALNPDLMEFWFGWRVKEIFLEKERFRDYCHNQNFQLDLSKLGKEQGIRYWLRGRLQHDGGALKAALIVTDTQEQQKESFITLTLDVSNHLIGFRKGFLTWLEQCGLPLPDAQRKMVLWPEKSNPEGLDLLGKALETYYLHSSWGEKGLLSLYWFDRAVSSAPASYLAHDLRAWALYKNKDYRAAEESFRSALTLNPHGLGALSGLMWCAIYTNDTKAAYSWAIAKADLRAESREEAKARVNKRIKKAAIKAKD